MREEYIEDAIYDIREYADKMPGEESARAQSAINYIEWYIWSGRADDDFVLAFVNCRKSFLLRKIVKVWNSEAKVLATAKKHLNVA